MMEVEPFEIDVQEAALEDLHDRLRRTRWPSSVADDWSDGTDLAFARDLADHWLAGYDWRAEEARLNALPQVLVRDVHGLDVHAVHRRGVGPDPLPLVLTHGWPSSFVEWQVVIDALADPGAHGGDPADAFHVVAPSLPGYGFSQIPETPGVSPRRIASMWSDVMGALGYDRFAAHGCDWGSYVTALIGLDHPQRVAGIHMGMVSLRGSGRRPEQDRTREELEYGGRVSSWRAEEQAYVAIQSTKPQTLGYGLSDSPAGLAAWIAEKWRAWSDCGGDLTSAIAMDVLLTNISIYWFTNTINSANRLYRESRLDPVRLRPGERVDVPAGFLLERPGGDRESSAEFLGVPRIGAPPRAVAETAFDVHRWTIAPRGGHFPALETPDLFVDEVRAFFRPLRDPTRSR